MTLSKTLQLTTMSKLSITPTNDPFPFAALALASYVTTSVDVQVDFDGDGSDCILTRADGTQVDEGESVVRVLAKSAHLESSSTQVF